MVGVVAVGLVGSVVVVGGVVGGLVGGLVLVGDVGGLVPLGGRLVVCLVVGVSQSDMNNAIKRFEGDSSCETDGKFHACRLPPCGATPSSAPSSTSPAPLSSFIPPLLVIPDINHRLID